MCTVHELHPLQLLILSFNRLFVSNYGQYHTFGTFLEFHVAIERIVVLPHLRHWIFPFFPSPSNLDRGVVVQEELQWVRSESEFLVIWFEISIRDVLRIILLQKP